MFIENIDQNLDLSQIVTKIEIFVNFDQNRDFWFLKILIKLDSFKILTKIEIFRKFWSKSRFFENYDQNRDFRKFWLKSRFFENFEKKKPRFYKNVDQTRDYRNF